MTMTGNWGSTGKLALTALVVAGCLAPTPGDVGGCGQEARPLDPKAFFELKEAVDCDKCTQCDLSTRVCERACDPEEQPQQDFPAGCFPVVHDGEVCLRALEHAACEDYTEYVSDTAPQVPTECNFCPTDQAP